MDSTIGSTMGAAGALLSVVASGCTALLGIDRTYSAEDGAPPDGAASDDAPAADGDAPVVQGCPVFPADNAWNTRVDDVTRFPTHARSATYLASMNAATGLHPDLGDWSHNQWGVPWETVPASQPGAPMTFVDPQSDRGPYPFPPNARSNGNVVVLQSETCLLFEGLACSYASPAWSCKAGARFDLRSGAPRADGRTSADAAGLPIFAGLVRLSEVQAGAIQHAIRFTMRATQLGYVHPATHAPPGSADPTLPPMGLRLRLKKGAVDLTMFSEPTSVILRAMQEYGILLADTGSDWYFTGDSDDGWTPLLDQLVTDFRQVHGSDFEVVDTGPVLTTGL
jgi:hypothetical protein